MVTSIHLGVCGAALVLAVAVPAHAQDTFKGREINLYVGSAPGGPYDAYARLIARHLGRHLPGNPGVVVQNMPGASGRRLMGYIYNVAPKDGTAIGTFGHDLVLVGLLGRNASVQFDSRVGMDDPPPRRSDVTSVPAARFSERMSTLAPGRNRYGETSVRTPLRPMRVSFSVRRPAPTYEPSVSCAPSLRSRLSLAADGADSGPNPSAPSLVQPA